MEILDSRQIYGTGPIIRHESGKPPAHPYDGWCGMGRISIDWRIVETLGEIPSHV